MTLSPIKCLYPLNLRLSAPFFAADVVATDEADVEGLPLVKLQYGSHENGIKTLMGFIAPKGSINPGMVNFGCPSLFFSMLFSMGSSFH
jgi:hypothetical protein